MCIICMALYQLIDCSYHPSAYIIFLQRNYILALKLPKKEEKSFENSQSASAKINTTTSTKI